MSRRRAAWTGLGVAGAGGLAGWTVFSSEAALVLAVGVVVAGLIGLAGGLAILAMVLLHGDEAPYRRLRGLLREMRERSSQRPE
jgi:hypothetical protein